MTGQGVTTGTTTTFVPDKPTTSVTVRDDPNSIIRTITHTTTTSTGKTVVEITIPDRYNPDKNPVAMTVTSIPKGHLMHVNDDMSHMRFNCEPTREADHDMERHYGKALFIAASILLGWILIAYVLLPIFADQRYAYEAGYLKKLGIAQAIVRYEDLLQMTGEPEEIIETMPGDHPKGWWQAVYKEFSVLFAGKGPTSEMRCVIITGSKHRFGRNKIGIGSSMEEVKEAYENVYISRDAPYTYLDDRMHVEFTYDENNVVCSIMITPYDLMV